MQGASRVGAFARWLAVIVWAAVIFGASSLQGSQVPGRFSVEGHLGEYVILGALLWWALGGMGGGWRPVLLAILIASLYGVSDEFHQSFVPGRVPDPADWALDTIGAATGALAAMAAVRLAKRRAERG